MLTPNPNYPQGKCYEEKKKAKRKRCQEAYRGGQREDWWGRAPAMALVGEAFLDGSSH